MRLCSEKTGFEVRPRKKVRIDLPAVADDVATAAAVQARVVLPTILVLQNPDGRAVTVFPDGRMLLRGMPEEEATRLASVLAPILYSSENGVSKSA